MHAICCYYARFYQPVCAMMHFTGGNQISLLHNGTQYFPALEAAIDGAQHEIHLQTYIYQLDDTGLRIGEALKHAASRGVSVYLLLDGFGSKDLPKSYVRELEAAGVEVLFFRPKISPWTLKRQRLRRLHRKVSVIDGLIAFVGGINIIDDYDTPRKIAPRVDYAVRVQGPLLRSIHTSTRKLWLRTSWVYVREAHPVVAQHVVNTEPSGHMRAAFVVRDNLWHRDDIERAYLTAIINASREIIIANAYFLPGRSFRRALLEAARRGVKVKLLLQGRMEYFILFATHAFYGVFLRNGIEIYEYQTSFMHSKVAVVDDAWATVGSSNIDPFSLLLAREANIVVNDAEFTSLLRADINRAIQQDAIRIKPEDWQRGHKLRRFCSWLAYGIVRLALGVIGYPNKH